jgi:hypothetical protein
LTAMSRNGFVEERRCYVISMNAQNRPTCLVYQVSCASLHYQVSQAAYCCAFTQVYIGTGSPDTVIGASGKAQRMDEVQWKHTRCAKILKTSRSGISYYRGKSLVTSKGDRVDLNGHVIFRRPADGQVNDFEPLRNQSLMCV